MPAQDATSPGMLAELARSKTQTHASLGNAGEVQRTLPRAEERYARTQETPEGWVGVVVLPDRSVLPARSARPAPAPNTSSQISSRR